MINAVGRDIPEEILEMTGKEVFQGNHYRDGYVYKKDGPYTKCVVNNTQSKLVANIHDVLVSRISPSVPVPLARHMIPSFLTSKTAPSPTSSLPVYVARSVKPFPQVN